MRHRSHFSFNTLAPSHDDFGIELQDLVADPSSNPVKHVESVELGALVKRAIAALPEDEHLVVVLKEYQGMKFSEIAEVMNRPIGTLKWLNYRAHERLRKYLAEYVGD